MNTTKKKFQQAKKLCQQKVGPEKTISHAMQWDNVASEVRRSACQMNYHVQYDGVCASMYEYVRNTNCTSRSTCRLSYESC